MTTEWKVLRESWLEMDYLGCLAYLSGVKKGEYGGWRFLDRGK